MVLLFGLFEGVEIRPLLQEQEPLRWLLRVIPQQKKCLIDDPFPPVLYGVSLDEKCNIAGYIQGELLSADSNQIRVVLRKSGLTVVNEYIISFDANTGQIHGSSSTGQITLQKTTVSHDVNGEPSSPTCLECHFMAGMASPHPLIRSSIPVNPIEWILLLLPSSEQGKRQLIGVGYVIAGDIPQHPILLYSISGELTSDGEIAFEKRYCTSEIALQYSGQQKPHPKYGFVLVGSWVNEPSMTKGYFYCRPQIEMKSKNGQAGICWCHQCNSWFDVGCPMLLANDGNSFCFQCCFPHNLGSGTEEEENSFNDVPLNEIETYCLQTINPAIQAPQTVGNFEVSSVFVPLISEKEPTSHVIQDAFEKFRYRPMLQQALPYVGSVKVYPILYGVVEAHCLDIANHLQKLLSRRSIVFVVGNTLDASTASAMLAVVLTQHVLVSVDPAKFFLSNEAQGPSGAECLQELVQRVETLRKAQSAPFDMCMLMLADYENVRSQFKSLCPDIYSAEIPPFYYDAPLDALECQEFVSNHAPLQKDELAALLFTSGTSGTSKCVEFSEDLMRPTEGTANIHPFLTLDIQWYDPTYILSLIQTMKCGGQRLLCGDKSLLYQAMQEGEPTHVGAPPAFWRMLAAEYANGATEKYVRDLLGRRLQAATSGGALLSSDLWSFFRHQLKIPLINLYGCREAGGIARDGIVYDGVDVKVLCEDGKVVLEEGKGEVIVNSPRLSGGYVGANMNVFFVFNGSRYYRTGDIGEVTKVQRGKMQTIVTIGGRLSTASKLDTGMWFSSSQVETILENHAAVHQAFVFKSQDEEMPENTYCAVVLDNVTDTVSPSQLRTSVLQSNRVPYEWTPTHFLILGPNKRFSPDNGMLTSTGKKCYNALREHFDSMFVLERFKAVPRLMLDASDIHPVLLDFFPNIDEGALESTLAQLGLDSLKAARLAATINAKIARSDHTTFLAKDLFHMKVSSISHVLNEQPLIGDFSSGRKEKRKLTASSCCVMSYAERVSFCDRVLRLPNWVHASLVSYQQQVFPLRKNVLMTGATGFLGPVLLHNLFQQFDESVIYCIIRGTNGSARLIKDCEKLNISVALLRKKVKVLQGEFHRPQLGLSNEDYSEVIQRCGAVIHNASYVSHDCPYEGMAEVNVDGTTSLAVFAALHNMMFTYVSSVAAVGSGIVTSSLQPFQSITTEQLVIKHENDPYGATKAVAESHLFDIFQMARQMGIPAHFSIVRPSAISPHSHISSYRNEKDLLIYLVQQCVNINAAPNHVQLELNCVPVDFAGFLTSFIAAFLFQSHSSKFSPKMLEAYPSLAEFPVFNVTKRGPLLQDIINKVCPDCERLALSDWKQRLLCAFLNAPEGEWSSEEETREVLVLKHLYNFSWVSTEKAAQLCTSTTQLVLNCTDEWPVTPLEFYGPVALAASSSDTT